MSKTALAQQLSKEARELFEDAVELYGIDDAVGQKHLLLAAEALDELRRAQVELRRSGLTTRDRHGCVRPHPCVAIARAARSAYVSQFRLLRLEPPKA
jgi:phage terminase small subunit